MSGDISDEIDPDCQCQDCSQERDERTLDWIPYHVVVVSPRFAPVIRESEDCVPKGAPCPGPMVKTVTSVVQWLIDSGLMKTEQAVARFYACNGDSEAAARDYITQLGREYLRLGMPQWADREVEDATGDVERAKKAYDDTVARFKVAQARRDSWRTVLSCHGLIETQEATVEAAS